MLDKYTFESLIRGQDGWWKRMVEKRKEGK